MAQTDTKKPNKTQLIILLAVAVLCFGIGAQYGRYLQKSEQETAALLAPLLEEQETPAALPPATPPEEEPALVAVHVKGAVEQPGMYELAEGSRVADALAKAGLLETANTDIINLALLVADGMEIIIPFRLEGEETDWQALAEESAAFTVNSSANAEAAASGKNTGPVNINSAGLTQLQTLTGIGPAKAQAIIDYREQHGAFARIEDIKKVSGIGDATFNNIKEHICVE